MCCSVTSANLVVLLLLAALIALAATTLRPFRFRGFVVTAWALVPVWGASAFAIVLIQSGHVNDGWFAALFYIGIFQPPWLLACITGLLLGAALRHARERFASRQRRKDHHE